MNKRLTGLIWLLTLLPLLVAAQDKSLKELKLQLDSMDTFVAETQTLTDTSEYATEKLLDTDGDEDADTDTTVTSDEPPKPHYLWDQDIPVSADSLGDSEYDGYEGGRLVLRKVPLKLLNELNADKKLQYDKNEKEKADRERDMRNRFGYLQAFIAGIFMLLNAYRWIIVIVIACALVGLLLYLLKARGFSFSFKKSEKAVVELAEEELDFDTYEQQIREAIAGNRFRLAVRLLYLQTLRLLADKEIISFSKEKTNAVYLRAMAQTKWYKTFANLTLDYEYIWYGEVPVNDAQFNVIHRHFSQFMNELGYTR
jgi:hypothetical protein